MKKILTLFVFIGCLYALVSCGEHTHSYANTWTSDDNSHWLACTVEEDCESTKTKEAHEWMEPVVVVEVEYGVDGLETYTCIICDHTKEVVIPALTHHCVFSDELTSDGEKHWYACTVTNCIKKKDAEAHEWVEDKVLKEPESGVEGKQRYVCETCGKTKTEPIPALPAKMSRDEWNKLLMLNNVQVRLDVYVGTQLATSEIMYVDGIFTMRQVEGKYYVFRTDSLGGDLFMIEDDFYSKFKLTPDGTYYAKSITMKSTGDHESVDMKNVTLTFGSEHIKKMSFEVEVEGVLCTAKYGFSNWGEVEFEIPKLGEEGLLYGVMEQNFYNYTVERNYYDEKNFENSTLSTISFNGDEYVEFSYDEKFNRIESFGTKKNAGLEMNEAYQILEKFEIGDFVYNKYTHTFECVAADMEDLDYLTVTVANGRISSVTWGVEGEFRFSYRMYDYNKTVLPEQEKDTNSKDANSI